MENESNKYLQQWPAEKITIENGRWGPYIRFGKKMLKLGKKTDGTKNRKLIKYIFFSRA
jgi:DNA topoisomerase I